MAVSHGTVQYLGCVRDLSLLADNEADGVREGFVMRGCPAPDSPSQHFLAELCMRFTPHLPSAFTHTHAHTQRVWYCSGSSHLLPLNPTPNPDLEIIRQGSAGPVSPRPGHSHAVLWSKPLLTTYVSKCEQLLLVLVEVLASPN